MQPSVFVPGTPLPFEKADNFRELGGYRAAGGRTVKRGLFWRSGALAAIQSPQDVARFEALGIRCVFDLRSSGERAYQPDPRFSGVQMFEISAILDETGREVNFDPKVIAAESESETVRFVTEGMRAIYARLPFKNPAYREMFRQLQEGNVPLLFHCTAGKDRTGVAAALILLALGVSRDIVMQDYMLTNVCRAETVARIQKKQPERAGLIGAIFGVQAHNLQCSLDAIDTAYPSFEAYLEGEYGIDAEQLAKLRDTYLE